MYTKRICVNITALSIITQKLHQKYMNFKDIFNTTHSGFISWSITM